MKSLCERFVDHSKGSVMRSANRSIRTVSAVGSHKDGYDLTRAEKKVLSLMTKGLRRKEVAFRKHKISLLADCALRAGEVI